MTKSIESLGIELSLEEEIERISPGVFAAYDAMKEKSSHIEVASAGGILKKIKKRSPLKTVYEFLALEAWNELLNQYSDSSQYPDSRGLVFRAPKPLGVGGLDKGNPELFMNFLNGYELRRLGQFKKTTPVRIPWQNEPIPLYPACALHLGALNEIKERENLYHEDYDGRHVLFSPASNVSIGVIDVENSRIEIPEMVKKESGEMYEFFLKSVNSSDKNKQALNSWYEQGREIIRNLGYSQKLPKIVEDISKKYNIQFDFCNMSLNGIHVTH